jgi:FkbM family methyltransferase
MLSTAAKIRIARLLYSVVHRVRWLFGGGDRVRARRRGINWDLDLREGIDLTIYLAGAFELDTLSALKRLVKEGDTVLDVGANIGAHTLHLARLVGPNGRVIAFEPTDFAVAKLRANLRANPDLESRVAVHQAFLVAEGGAAFADTVPSSWPVDGSVPDDLRLGSCGMRVAGALAVTVDSVVAAAGGPDIALIKMDVDGNELEVLEGARSLLQRCRPSIVMELAPYVFRPIEKFDAMVNLLGSFNYSFRRLASAIVIPAHAEALRAMIPFQGSVNVIALPRETAGAKEAAFRAAP